MFAAILSSILGSINSITYKKAVDHAEKFGFADILMIWTNQMAEWPLYIVAHLVLPVSMGFSLVWSDITWGLVVAFIVLAVAQTFSNLASQYACSHEKVSVLAPYGELSSVFTVIMAALLPFSRGHTSWYLIVIALITGLVVALSSIDPKNLTFNKYCAVTMLESFTGAVENIASVYLLTKVTSLTVISAQWLLLLAIASGTLLTERHRVPLMDRNWHILWGYAFLNNVIWCVKQIIILTIVTESGIITATLLGMLQFIGTLTLAYFYLGDIPSKKNLWLGIFVMLAVGLGLWG